jgi:hypothetical protein
MWVKNQTLDIIQQLELGIRLLDFRLSYCYKRKDIFFSHTFMTEETFEDVMDKIYNYNIQHPEKLLLLINIRVDYKDRNSSEIIQDCLNIKMRKYSQIILKDIENNILQQKGKILFFNQDDTLKNNFIISKKLMPEVSLWDAENIDECERRLNNLEVLFTHDRNQYYNDYILPNEKLVVFDYSSYLPLYFTDKKQIELMTKYKKVILDSNPTIISGNNIEEIIKIFE